jgi:alpha-N-arabinofuranosidase
MIKKILLSFVLSLFVVVTCWSQNEIIVNADQGTYQISRDIYGQFAEHLGHGIYGGIWVGENSPIPNTRGIRNDVVAALKKIKVPVIRWPGGCFADTYHWKDGIGPRGQRPKIVNVNWGNVTEDNAFGTHEFLDLCSQLGCDPYIVGNVGSGTIQEMSDWVNYVNFNGSSPMTELRKKNGRDQPWKVRFWGVGNESWGCGGSMSAEYYANVFKRYATFLRNYPGAPLYRIACGPNSGDYHWTEVMMKNAGHMMQGLSLHYYSVIDWNHKGSATHFSEGQYADIMEKTLALKPMIARHMAIMDQYDPSRRVGLIIDEWGGWYDVEPGTNPAFLYQQNTMRDALLASTALNIFNNDCARVRMANIAQMVNVLQAMILTKGSQMIVTPTYDVYQMYTVHHDALMLPTHVTSDQYTYGKYSMPAINASSSRDSTGVMHISISNLDPDHGMTVPVEIRGAGVKTVTGTVLHADSLQAHNTFSRPDAVKPAVFKAFGVRGSKITVKMPPASIVVLAIK